MLGSLGTVNKKYRRLGITLLLMVVLAVAQPFLWNFVHAQALSLQQRQSQGEQITNVRERNADVAAKLAASRDFLSQLDVVAPLASAKTHVVERVELLADQLGLALDITVIQEVQNNAVVVSNDHVAPVSMSMTTTGTIQQLLAFLDRVEHTQELSLVPTWSLVPATVTTSAQGVTSGVDQYTLTMDVYFFLRPATDG